MNPITLTAEQLSVVQHPLGSTPASWLWPVPGKHHARLSRSVPGAGVPGRTAPHPGAHVQRLARVQFQERLTAIGIPRYLQPPIDTFHASPTGCCASGWRPAAPYNHRLLAPMGRGSRPG
jgi:hypothetical protein